LNLKSIPVHQKGATPLAEPVPSLHVLRETVPEDVERVVTKALAKAPADRFATAEQFAQSLNKASMATRTIRRRRPLCLPFHHPGKLLKSYAVTGFSVSHHLPNIHPPVPSTLLVPFSPFPYRHSAASPTHTAPAAVDPAFVR